MRSDLRHVPGRARRRVRPGDRDRGGTSTRDRRIGRSLDTRDRRKPMEYGAIDIVCNPNTRLEVESRQVGVDEHFMDKVRMPQEMRSGVELDEYVAKMDRAGIERSLLIAVRAGDMRVKYSFAIPYERVAGYCEQFPGRFHGLAG